MESAAYQHCVKFNQLESQVFNTQDFAFALGVFILRATLISHFIYTLMRKTG